MGEEKAAEYSPLGARLTIFVFTVWLPLIVATIVGGRFWRLADLGAIAVFLGAALRTGLSFDESEMVVRNLFVTRRFRWSEVDRLEPSTDGDADQLVAIVRGKRQRLLITIGPGARGAELSALLRSILGSHRAEGVMAFRPPTDPRWWSRRRSSWLSR